MDEKQNNSEEARAEASPPKRDYDPDFSMALIEIVAEAHQRTQPQVVWDQLAQAQARSKLVDPPKAEPGGGQQPKTLEDEVRAMRAEIATLRATLEQRRTLGDETDAKRLVREQRAAGATLKEIQTKLRTELGLPRSIYTIKRWLNSR